MAVPQNYMNIPRPNYKFGFWWSVPKTFATNIIPLEGGLVINPVNDPGGNTNRGIIWDTYAGGGWFVLGHREPTAQERANELSDNFKNLTERDVFTIVEKLFYNNEDLPASFGGYRYNLGKIHDESIQMIILYSIWGSGYYGQNTVRKMQEWLKVTQDNTLGPETISAVNALSLDKKEALAEYLISERWEFLKSLWNFSSFPGWIKAVWYLQDFDSFYRKKKR